MGADGGSIPRRDELVRTKARDRAATGQQDPTLLLRALWTLCALSRLPLAKPIVSDATGRLYNKEAVVRFLLGRADPAAERDPLDEAVAGHLKGLKDLRELFLEPNPAFRRRGSPVEGNAAPSSVSSSSAAAPSGSSSNDEASASFPFICALTQKELNGKARFVYLRSCGCVLAEAGLRTVAASSSSSSKGKEKAAVEANSSKQQLDDYECPLCSKPFRASPTFFSNSKLAAATATATAAAARTSEVETALLRYDPHGDIVPLNPPLAEQEALRAAFLANRAAGASSTKKRKVAAAAKAEGGDAAGTALLEDGGDEKARKKAEARAARQATIAKLSAELAADGTHPGTPDAAAEPAAKRARTTGAGTGAGAVAKAPQPQEKEKEKKEMSAAIRSIYGLDRPKDPKGESWMVRGTFNRYA
ncbi:Replication termination factor 2 [Tilletia horrida]|nr:Replication termination factor 2 [Tilletia horrida]